MCVINISAQITSQSVQGSSHRIIREPQISDSVYTLPHLWLVPGSLTLRQGLNYWYEGRHYSINYSNHQIHLLHEPDTSGSILITYKYYPFALKRHYSITYASGDSTAIPDSSIAISSGFIAANAGRSFGMGQDKLEKSGSIFRGVSIGSGGMRLQSGLRLQVSGEIARGVEIMAALTDQATPIQPEGNTQALQEIDKVYVHVKMRNAEATLGDLVFDATDYGMGGYSRKLQGVSTRLSWRNGEASILAAASKGEFKTQYIQGLESVQGPYQLTGPKGQREIIILAGTEKVYVDGRLMTRGEEHDFVIDYANGQITFTQHRLITGDSRINVEFEYSDQKFQKTVTGAVANADLWDKKIKISASMLRETDDKDNPLDIILTDSTRQILKMAGDHPDSAAVNGEQYVGDGKGSYRKIVLNGQDVFEYAGTAQGNYSVRFSYAGTNKGSYSFQGFGIYQYEGTDLGDFLPVIFLPVARQKELATLKAAMHISSKLSAEAEIGFSGNDENLYSNRDDNDNNDKAVSASVSLQPSSLKIRNTDLGKISMKLRWRDVGERFRFAGRASEVEHGRKWRMEEGRDWGESTTEFNTIYQLSDKSKISWETGKLSRIEGDQSTRQMATMDIKQPMWPNLYFLDERIKFKSGNNEGQWIHRIGRLDGKISIISFDTGYREEEHKDAHPDSIWTGSRYREWSGGVGIKKGQLTTDFQSSLRRYHHYQMGRLEGHSRASTQEFNLDWNAGTAFKWMLTFTQRLRKYDDITVSEQSSDLAESRLTLTPWKGALDLRLNYRYASNRASEMVRDTIEVGEGLGNYRIDESLNELVPDSDGNLLVRQIQTGRFIPVNQLRMTGDLRFTGSRLWKKSWKHALRWRSTLKIERRDKDRQFFKVNEKAFSPRWGRDSTMVSGQFMHQHDMEYRPRKSKIELRLRFRQNQMEMHQLMNEGQIRLQEAVQLRVKVRPGSGFNCELTAKWRRDDRDFESRLRSDRKIENRGAEFKLSYRLMRKLELGMDGTYNSATDKAPDIHTRANAIFLKPRFKWTVGRKGHLRGEYEIGHLAVYPAKRALPYEMFNGDQPGNTQRWSLYFSYRLSSFVQTTLTYRGRNEPWRTYIYHLGQVEVRAFF